MDKTVCIRTLAYSQPNQVTNHHDDNFGKFCEVYEAVEAVETSVEAEDAVGGLVDAVEVVGGRIDGDSSSFSRRKHYLTD